ncbi:ABC-2 type transport system permease protein [Lipingzhangella halophila]|uniref:ABC-2 type transport system permease protein n=1 Tax=Lipingzhangella halophila TaxID=1783352 RepID=A0A7W7W4P7_9ACTN|nr:ABC transporter permease [Lipingzhangella halophila]MBB4932955.1 ABC-2 type transport system permease protein [Lipingzhangella halophila]
MTLAVQHARLLFVETARVPIALGFNVAFPTVLMLFFVVPNSAIADDPAGATVATAQITVFAVMNSCLLNFGVGVAEERARAWDPYLRTLPAGPLPRMAGRVLNGFAYILLAVTPVVLVAPLLTEATLPPSALGLAIPVIMFSSLPFLFGGFAIGYSMSVKGALPTAQAVMFPMAFAGGLFLPPETFPGWLDTVSRVLPTRAARELGVWAVVESPVSVVAIAALCGWTALTMVLAVWAYRRDEGRRFR